MKPTHFFTASLAKSSLLLLFFSTMVVCAAAQVTISGKVTDDAGKPASGITVQVSGDTRGSATDNNGNYEVKFKSTPGSAPRGTFTYDISADVTHASGETRSA